VSDGAVHRKPNTSHKFGGKIVANAAELTAALDELPGDELGAALQSDALKSWMQNIGMQPSEIADLMARYR
jgi:hypothetical protein